MEVDYTDFQLALTDWTQRSAVPPERIGGDEEKDNRERLVETKFLRACFFPMIWDTSVGFDEF